jgi:uracil-DNA glycosylase family 4
MRWHKGASISEIKTCKMWLQKEVEIVKPKVIVCLGRSAALSVTGKLIKISEASGKFFESPYATKTIILPHPASILRAQDQAEEKMEEFISGWSLVKDYFFSTKI